MSEKVRIALLQHTCSADPADNKDKVMRMIREAAGNGADIICTQELAFYNYFCQTGREKNFRLAKPVPCDDTDDLSALAEELGTVIIYSMIEKAMTGVYYNTCVVFDSDGSYLGRYRQNHVPEDPMFLEKFYFTPSDLGYPVFDTAFGRIGVLICWDQWFPEAARLIALKGAEIIFNPTSIGFTDDFTQEEYRMWQNAVRAQGIYNQLFIAACNRVGEEFCEDGSVDFFGGTFVSDPYGKIIAEDRTKMDEIIYADIQPSVIEEVRHSYPLFRDRRVDTYGGLLKKDLYDEEDGEM